MFETFKKKISRTANNVMLMTRSNNEIIEEIHNSFYTEVDKLLAESKISKSLDTDKQDLIDKCTRLKNLGFTNTKEVKEAELEIKRIEALKIENENKTSLIQAINYFSFKYPHYKFITEDSVKKICEKYNLIYGTIDRYIGTVPSKNLKQMEDFYIKDVDKAAISYSEIFGMGRIIDIKYHSVSDMNKVGNTNQRYNHGFGGSIDHNEICPLEIAAPLSDFNMEKYEVKNFKLSKIEIPDPVVLQPVVYNNQKYYLIVTAWGLESEDELVVNQNNN